MALIRKFTIIVPDRDKAKVLKDYSFDIYKDLENLNLTPEKLLNLLEEQGIDIETGLKGERLSGNTEFNSIKKFYINYRNVGSKRGLRVIALVVQVEDLAIVLHVYSKSKKKDMSEEEYKNLRLLLKDFDI